MKEFTYVIKEELGLHARPAGLLVKEAKKFQSATTLAAKGKTAAAGKLIAIMSMGVKQGDEVTVQVEGPDEGCCVRGTREVLPGKSVIHRSI